MTEEEGGKRGVKGGGNDKDQGKNRKGCKEGEFPRLSWVAQTSNHRPVGKREKTEKPPRPKKKALGKGFGDGIRNGWGTLRLFRG